MRRAHGIWAKNVANQQNKFSCSNSESRYIFLSLPLSLFCFHHSTECRIFVTASLDTGICSECVLTAQCLCLNFFQKFNAKREFIMLPFGKLFFFRNQLIHITFLFLNAAEFGRNQLKW